MQPVGRAAEILGKAYRVFRVSNDTPASAPNRFTPPLSFDGIARHKVRDDRAVRGAEAAGREHPARREAGRGPGAAGARGGRALRNPIGTGAGVDCAGALCLVT